MIGLAVYLNGKKLTVAGADDLSVLNAIVSGVGKLGKYTAPLGAGRKPDLWVTVGGLTHRGKGAQDEHLRWIGHKRLRVGDTIKVEVVRTDRPSRHIDATVAVPRKPLKRSPSRKSKASWKHARRRGRSA